MENVILTSAIVLLLASVLGGNVEALGIKIPKVTSKLVRGVLLLLSIAGISYVIAGNTMASIAEKHIEDSLSIHKNYLLGYNSIKVDRAATSEIFWIKIESIRRYKKGLYSMTYRSPQTGTGFIVFRADGRKLFGLWKDDTNKDARLPGIMELEFLDNSTGRIAEGWWSYDEASEKYYCYLREQ